MKKKTKALALCGICAAMGIGLATAAGSALGFGGTQIVAAKHDSSHVLTEKAYTAPTTTGEGYKPYWHCAECCKVSANEARYDYADKTTNVALGDIVMPKLTAATKDDVAEGDLITSVNTQKFKYVDQGVDGPEATSDKKESAPEYVKDGDKTALFFSRSGKTGDPYNATSNDYCSEFRFSPTGYASIASVTFSYRYLDYGKGVWAGGSSTSEPAGWHSMIQFKDSTYYGKAFEFVNDDQWHTVTIAYNTYESAGNKDFTTNFSDIIFKFVDMRGHFYISGLSFDAPASVTLKNVNADGSESTAKVLKGKLPATPTMEGKTFAGWYDEEGNKVETVTTQTTLIARWSIEKRSLENKTLMALPHKDANYAAVDDAHVKLSVRDGDWADDIEKGNYPDIEGAAAFVAWKDGWYGGAAGVKLPAFNFSTAGKVFFNFGLTEHATNLFLEGQDCGTSWHGIFNYEVTVNGKALTVYNVHDNKDTTITLSDAVYNGQEGLSITSSSIPCKYLYVTPFKSLTCDYITESLEVEKALSDTPTANDISIRRASAYEALRNEFTAEEKALYPVSAKMQGWLDKLPRTVVAFEDHGKAVQAAAIGDTGQIVNNDAGWTNANTKDSLGSNTPFDLDPNSLVFEIMDMRNSYVTFTLPAIDTTQYSKVVFTMGFGGNGGGRRQDFAYGGIDESKVTHANGEIDITKVDNYIGGARPTATNAWSGYADDIVVTMSEDAVTFNAKSGDSTIKNKSFTMDEDVKTGKKGITLSMAHIGWEFFVISPFTGYKM